MELLPDTDDLIPLRGAVAGSGREDSSLAWSGSEAYGTVDTLLLDLELLQRAIPEAIVRERERVEAVYARVGEALRSVAAGEEAAGARALVAAGEVEEGAGRLPAAESFYRRALALGRRPHDRRTEGLALRRLGRVARARGELDESLRLYRGSFEVADAMEDAAGSVVACQGMGNVLSDRGGWDEAVVWFERGLERAGDSPTRERWQLEVNLSNVHRRAGRLRESEAWLRHAERTVETLEDAAGRVYVLNSRGLLRLATGDAAGADSTYESALAYATTPAERATVLINRAETLLRLGRIIDSEAAVRELERTALAHRLVGFLAHAYRALGAVARARSDGDGFIFFEQALSIAEQEGGTELEAALTQEEYGLFQAALGDRDSGIARLEVAKAGFTRLGSAPDIERVTNEIRELSPSGGGSLNDGKEGGPE
jgi:tetratricopeptide (TPR) repeat protein